MGSYNLDEIVKLSINNLVAAIPKPAKAAAVCEFKPHCDWITRLVYVDGQGLFSCSSDGTVVLSEVSRGEKKWSVKAHKKGVNDIAWCHSQQWLASCGLGRAILLWQISISSPVFTLEGHQASVRTTHASRAKKNVIFRSGTITLSARINQHSYIPRFRSCPQHLGHANSAVCATHQCRASAPRMARECVCI